LTRPRAYFSSYRNCGERISTSSVLCFDLVQILLPLSCKALCVPAAHQAKPLFIVAAEKKHLMRLLSQPLGTGEQLERTSMSKFSWVLLMTTFVGSLLGGMLAERLFDRGVVHAQKANGVNAEEFLLLDQAGKARAGLGLDANGEVGLVLTSRDGNRTLALSPDGPVAVKLSERSGRIVWSAP
jgi:hypothetical protein